MVETQRNAQVLDPRGAFKAPTFSGKRDEFESWAFQFESYVGLLGWSDWLVQVRELITEVDELEMSEQTVAVSRQLYHLLVTVVKGPALSIVRLAPRGEGFEAMRRLYRDFRTGLEEDHAVMLASILTPVWWNTREDQLFTDILMQWDELIADYQMASKEHVTDGMKTATIIAHAPDKIKGFVQTCPRETRSTHPALRKAIWEFVLGGRGSNRVPERFQPTPTTTPMEVDAVYKGKGKGKSCHSCGKPGHFAKDCWAKGGAEGKGKGERQIQ
jgi:hypothetical protein